MNKKFIEISQFKPFRRYINFTILNFPISYPKNLFQQPKSLKVKKKPKIRGKRNKNKHPYIHSHNLYNYCKLYDISETNNCNQND